MQPRLYFMIKPPSEVAAVIAALPHADRRDPGLLHMTLLPLGDRPRHQPGFVDALIDAGDAVRHPPFRVVFDRLVGNGHTLVLRGSEAIEGAVAFQPRLVETLRRHGLAIAAHRFAPHVTIDYRSDRRETIGVDPVSWLVEEFLLVESIVGEGRHVTLGRWRLE